MKSLPCVAAVVAAVLMATTGATALADEHGDRHHEGGRPHDGRPNMRFDARYHHDHYYPQRGFSVAVLPPRPYVVPYRGGRYFYSGGVWYRPYGRSYVVIDAPFGAVVPVLPPAYATLTFGGQPYYYANGVYYAPGPQGYTVVAPPPGAEADPGAYQEGAMARAPEPMPPQQSSSPPEPIVYPRNGQPPQQVDADRADCNRWAGQQPRADSDVTVFQRGFAACLEGRGYTVR